MNTIHDLVGIGVGPFNLSIAALSHGISDLDCQFFESKPVFNWHPGMLLPNAALQTSYLKDLVTGVEPTSRFSFLAYLVAKKRFYAFLNSDRAAISRQEYADYLRWVSQQLPQVHFDHAVQAVTLAEHGFDIHFADRVVASRHLCLGTGKVPYLPNAVRHLHDRKRCFHAIGFANEARQFAGKRVAIIGGGQSGAEIFLHLLQGSSGLPSEISWLSRRSNFLPLDETPFTNEWFAPRYTDSFFPLATQQKRQIVEQQKLASDGISPSTLQTIYQAMYEQHVSGQAQPRVQLLPNRSLQTVQDGAPYLLTAENGHDGAQEQHVADIIILATGFSNQLPACLTPLLSHLQLDAQQQLQLDRHYRVALSAEAQTSAHGERRIYAVNHGRYSHGIAEPQMSLMCWRSATIINDLLDRPQFDLLDNLSFVQWQSLPALSAAECA